MAAGNWYNNGDWTAFPVWHMKYVAANLRSAVNELLNICGIWQSCRYNRKATATAIPVQPYYLVGEPWPIDISPETFVGYCYEQWDSPNFFEVVTELRADLTKIAGSKGHVKYPFVDVWDDYEGRRNYSNATCAFPVKGAGMETGFTDLKALGPGIAYFLTKAGYPAGWIPMTTARSSAIWRQIRDVVLAIDRVCWDLAPHRQDMPLWSLGNLSTGRNGYVGTSPGTGWQMTTSSDWEGTPYTAVSQSWTVCVQAWNDAENIYEGELALSDSGQYCWFYNIGPDRQMSTRRGIGMWDKAFGYFGVGVDIGDVNGINRYTGDLSVNAWAGMVRRGYLYWPTDRIIGAKLRTQLQFFSTVHKVRSYKRPWPSPAPVAYIPLVCGMQLAGYGTYTPPFTVGEYGGYEDGWLTSSETVEAPDLLTKINTGTKEKFLFLIDGEPGAVPDPVPDTYDLWNEMVSTGLPSVAWNQRVASGVNVGFSPSDNPNHHDLTHDGMGTWVWTNIASHRVWR